jgi:hypothetical protein
MIGAVAAGRLVGRIGTRPFAVVGLALVAIGNALLIGVSADGNVYAEALPGVTVFALGGGPLFVCGPPLPSAASPARGWAGSGIVNTFNQLGARYLCCGGLHRCRRGSHPHALDRGVHRRLHRVHRRRRRGRGGLAPPGTVRNATSSENQGLASSGRAGTLIGAHIVADCLGLC